MLLTPQRCIRDWWWWWCRDQFIYFCNVTFVTWSASISITTDDDTRRVLLKQRALSLPVFPSILIENQTPQSMNTFDLSTLCHIHNSPFSCSFSEFPRGLMNINYTPPLSIPSTPSIDFYHISSAAPSIHLIIDCSWIGGGGWMSMAESRREGKRRRLGGITWW